MESRKEHSPAVAAAKAGFSRASGYRIESDSRPPSQRKPPRGRRRPDPLAGIFDEEVVPMLTESSGLRAVAVFEELRRRRPDLPVGVRRNPGTSRAALARRARSRAGGDVPPASPTGTAGTVGIHIGQEPGSADCRSAVASPAVPLSACLQRLRIRRAGARRRKFHGVERGTPACPVERRRCSERAPHR